MPKTSTAQDAIRLLYIFVHGAQPVAENQLGYAGCFGGKARLHAMDFWVRYPDYLSYELLNKYEVTKIPKYLELSRKILDDQEPDLRSIPMIRYRFGAFDDLNESLAILISKGLVIVDGEKSNNRITSYDYYITPRAKQLINDITFHFPILSWYNDRALLVCEIAGNLGGSALKEIQYRHMSYANTGLGSLIPSIKEEVIKRLKIITDI